MAIEKLTKQMPPRTIWTHSMAVLMTGHITRSTADALTKANRTGNYDLLPGVATVADYEDGWFIRFYAPQMNPEESADAELRASEDLRALRQWTLDRGEEWVRLDSIGDSVPELEQYDW